MKTDIERIDAARSGADAASAVDYATFPNAMPASREAAPRLGRAYAAGTADQKEVYECMKELGCQMGEAEAVRVWNATAFVIKDNMPKDGRAYDIGFVRFFPALTGTFGSADADFDPNRNRLYVAAAPSDDIRNALSDGTPTRIDWEAANDAHIKNVTWGDGSDRNTIKSGEPFSIYGSGLTIGGGGERAELTLPDGGGTVAVTLSAPADDKGLGQRLVGHLATDVEACEGATLTVQTHGFDPEAAIQTVKSEKLTILAGDTPVVPAPTIDAAVTQGFEPGNIEAPGGVVEVSGSNLETATAIELLVGEDGTPVEEMELWKTLSATYDAEGEVLATNGVIEDSAPQSFGMVRVTTAGGTAVYPVQYSVH